MLSLGLISLVLFSCSGKRKVRQAQPSVQLQDTVRKPEPVPSAPLFRIQPFEYRWFSSRISAEVSWPGEHYTVALFLVVRKDSVLFLSCNKLGIEMGRLRCTPDSLMFMVHLNSTYWKGTYADLYRETGLSIHYDIIQALFTGNDMEHYSRNFQWYKEENVHQIWVDRNRRHPAVQAALSDQLTLDSNGRVYNHYLLQQSQSVSVKYRNMTAVENSHTLFPAEVTLSMSKLDLLLLMQYKSAKINVQGPLACKIPSKYKRLQLPKLL